MANSVIVENELLLKTIKRHDCDCYVMRGPIDSVNFIPKYDKTTDAINIGWTGSPATFPTESLLPIIDDLGSLNKIKLI